MRWKSHVQCESGEKLEITSNSYLSISKEEDIEEFNKVFQEIIDSYTSYKNGESKWEN